jgi:transposase
MSPRRSSIATTTLRKARGSAAVTTAAASGSIGRPKGSGRASRVSGAPLADAEPRARAKGKDPQRPAVAVFKTVTVRSVKRSSKVADLPPKGVTTSGPPTRSKAQYKRGEKEGTAVSKVVASAGVSQQSKPAASSSPQAAHAQRKSVASPIALATSAGNVAPLGPIERFVGLDIGKSTEFCEVRREQVTRRAAVRKEKDLEALLEPGTGRARVVLEACREAWYLFDLLTGWGHEVWVVDTTRVRQLGIGQHRRKNDRIDAEILARAGESGRVPRAHVLSHASQRLRLQLGVRRALVETRAQYVGSIRSMLRSEGLAVPSCAVEAFVGKLKATKLPPAVHDVIKPLVVALEAIGPQIEKVDKVLDERCAELPVVQLLSSAPGVGRIVSAAFVSVIDNPGRFRNAHQVEAYLGLVPSESTSGKRKLGAITKQGNSYLRAMLVQASWNVLRKRGSDPLKSWGQALAKRRGKRVAVVAVARRLAGILWAMWRDNNPYAASNVGQASARGKRNEAERTAQTANTIQAAAVSK